MARQNGFTFEVTAFLPVETHVAGVAEAVTKMEKATEYFHALGFASVAVSSKFTSRKVEAAPAPFDRERHAADILNNGFTSRKVESVVAPLGESMAQLEVNHAAKVLADGLDIPPELDRRVKPAGA